MRVVYIGERIKHHAGHSGYDQLVRHVRSRRLSPSIRKVLTRIIQKSPPGWFESWLDSPPYSWYWKPEQLAQEIQAVAAMPVTRKVYHWLYGENDFRWAGHFPRRKDAKVVVSMHQPPEVFQRVFPNPKTLTRADAVLACCSSQEDHLKKLAGESKVHVILHGVDVEFFTPGPRPGGEKFVVLMAGSWLRDFYLLTKVITEAHSKRTGLYFHLVLPPDRIKDFQGAPNTAVFCGIPDRQLRNLYQSANVLFMPVTDFTASNTLLEGMACGLPVVTADVGGMRDYLDSSCGVFIPPNDPKQALDALMGLKQNPKIAAYMAESARIKALEYDWKTIAMSVEEVYKNLYA